MIFAAEGIGVLVKADKQWYTRGASVSGKVGPGMSNAIVLGSASPRRADLLRQIGLSFDVIAGSFDETLRAGEDAAAYCKRIAFGKARDVAARCGNRIIIGADTVVVTEDSILGKPADDAEARLMLTKLSGRTHRVITGVSVLERPTGECELFAVASHVSFRVMDPEEINRYIDTREPIGKAGSYAIQGKGAVFVRSISGSYSNIMGLPLYETALALARFGVRAV